MKRLFSLLGHSIFLSLLVLASYSQSPKQKGNKIEVLFTTTMTKDSLENIKALMKEKNIKLEFVETKFDAEGHLTALGFKVDCNDGFGGAAETKDLKKAKRFGFFRDYRKKTALPFAVGNLNDLR